MANLVVTRDGDWRAVWSRAFYRHARSAGALYRAILRDELTRQFGVEWRPRRHGLYEIAGIPSRCCARSAAAAPTSSRNCRRGVRRRWRRPGLRRWPPAPPNPDHRDDRDVPPLNGAVSELGNVAPYLAQHPCPAGALDEVTRLRLERELLRNDDTATVQTIHADGSVTVTRDRGQAWLPHSYVAQHLDHGYALTIHASQGLTIPHTHVLANDALFYEAGLVAPSRHRDTCHLYDTEKFDLEPSREITHVRQSPMLLSDRLHMSRADRAASSYSRSGR